MLIGIGGDDLAALGHNVEDRLELGGVGDGTRAVDTAAHGGEKKRLLLARLGGGEEFLIHGPYPDVGRWVVLFSVEVHRFGSRKKSCRLTLGIHQGDVNVTECDNEILASPSRMLAPHRQHRIVD